MKKIAVCTLLLSFFLGGHADMPAANAIESQQTDQNLCIQQATAACLDKCQQTAATDCATACPQTAKNQCLQAGE